MVGFNAVKNSFNDLETGLFKEMESDNRERIEALFDSGKRELYEKKQEERTFKENLSSYKVSGTDYASTFSPDFRNNSARSIETFARVAPLYASYSPSSNISQGIFNEKKSDLEITAKT